MQVAKKRPPEDVHIHEIVDSVNTGRYFTMKKYNGAHDNFCNYADVVMGNCTIVNFVNKPTILNV